MLCENLDTLDEPEAKASMIWIIGEYAERIDNADELLEQFLETFPEETALVGAPPPTPPPVRPTAGGLRELLGAWKCTGCCRSKTALRVLLKRGARLGWC